MLKPASKGKSIDLSTSHLKGSLLATRGKKREKIPQKKGTFVDVGEVSSYFKYTLEQFVP